MEQHPSAVLCQEKRPSAPLNRFSRVMEDIMVEYVRKDPASSRKERGFIYAYDLFRKGEIEKSLAAWQLLLQKKNNAKEKGLIYGQMGRCYLLLGDVEKALDSLSKRS